MEIDIAILSIDSNIRDALSEDASVASNAYRVLGFFASQGRTDAMVFLLGLPTYHRDDFKRLGTIAEALEHCATPVVTMALFEEIRRIEVSNTTRSYVNLVIKILSGFPQELVREEFECLADDRSYSPKMRAKFRDVADSFYI